MSSLEGYRDRYENIAFERENGVLQVTLHTDGGPFVLSRKAHTDMGAAWADVAEDPENKVVILTGTGAVFCTELDGASLQPLDTPEGWHLTYHNGKRLLQNFLDIEVPVISAINGPARNMSELPLLADVVLASDTADFQDAIHFNRGVVPADGMHVVWLELLGTMRGKYFLLTEQLLSAQEAHELGVVSEVVPADRLMERARELAERMAELPDLTLRYTRVALNQRMRRRLEEGLGYGLALEGLSVINAFSEDPERANRSSATRSP
jgi:enoyl-CoA hydratase/carnithine racemase